MPKLVVFSGGTAFNGVAEELTNWTTSVAHVLPVSDDGGSTAEIVRVLGGPAVGDIRSRCLRLTETGTAEALAVKKLLGHRLHPTDELSAKREWQGIVEGEHALWDHICDPYKHTIRAFLVHFHTEILRQSTERFSFANGSVGNFFFAGARVFFQSLDAAIFLYSRVSRIPIDSVVLPVVNTSDRLTLGAVLADATLIRGQHAISHPSETPAGGRVVNKSAIACPSLPSPISRVLYLAYEGSNNLHEVFPAVNPAVLGKISDADAVIYAMGSLYTSIIPCLLLRGVGEAIAARPCRKLLLMNGSRDRETGGVSAVGYIRAIVDALNRAGQTGGPARPLNHPASAYIDTVVVPRGGEMIPTAAELATLGIPRLVVVDSEVAAGGMVCYHVPSLVAALKGMFKPAPQGKGKARAAVAPPVDGVSTLVGQRVSTPKAASPSL
eukprot:jgi/Mesvir1/22780/Mv14170-RA.1